MKDFYYILGVDSDCATGEIKDAYRKLSKKFHPDLNDGDEYFVNRFREINQAYETLNDPAKRFQYDSSLKKLKSKHRAYDTHFDIQSSESTSIKPERKPSGRIFNITWVVVAIVLGAYLLKSLTDTKKSRVIVAQEISPPPLKVRKHHKPIYVVKTKIIHNSPKVQPDTVPIKPAKSVPLVNKMNIPNFLYATYVHANLTGVINMRQTDGFNSDVIAKIPSDSKVFVLERGEAYYRVLFNNNTGYVPKWSLQEK